jgi:GNAT superfamily N-acetyltransferase
VRTDVEFDSSKDRVDLEQLWAFLSELAYWSRWRTRDDIAAQLASAWRVVGMYATGSGDMIGFARAMSDGVALAYLADVYVDPRYRGGGLGVELVRVMIEDGPGRDFRWLLHTSDAHELYSRFGFVPADATALERPGAH